MRNDWLSIKGGGQALIPELCTLGETEPGDVFYLASDPSLVYMRHPRTPRWEDDHFFTEMNADAWRKIESVGSGKSDQVVIVIHNTIKGVPA